ncbi:hypothetical protein Pint_29479 [Pistacia integerrima]|uniref:Uncharacterized protein n=1 Tax=Pistacia integerrima TaxID=434235 RepID=A0ACC0X0N0_9ROSI|nr:hypothetical protein Pint_29479 [Pistacia integerrima]
MPQNRVLLFLLLLVIQLQLFCPCYAAVACNQNDRDSLLSFFSNISSSSSSLNWSSSIDCCLWDGVDCDAEDGRVTHLRLPFRGLTATLSPSLANLTRLSHLDLSHNRLFGRIPTSFFFSLNHLLVLDLSFNLLSGQLPTNHFDNNITAIDIQNLDLSSNYFEGSIPSISFLQTAWSLTTFNISNNSFTGPIPSFLCSDFSRSLRQLDFSYNDFSNQIPSGLGQCSQLEILRAGFNNLSGAVPRDIYSIASLQQLSLAINHLSGPIHDSIVNLSNLRVLELYSNEFTGLIPKDIGKLSNLEKLLLHINNLTGSLPPSLMNCIKLTTLNLRVNNLEGNLSAFNFSSLIYLNTLDLGNNQFTGILPPSLYSCKSLTAVRLASNQLEGQILPDILALQSLSFLSLRNNSLTGSIPVEIGQLKVLHVLDLSQNKLSGNIPDGLSNLTNLEILDLSVNRLSGEIPTSLRGLHFLSSFNVAANNLEGPIPSGGPTPPTASHKSTNIKLLVGLVIGICFGTGLIITMLALLILSKRRIIPREVDKDTSLVILFQNNTNEVKDLTISELLKATDNFSQANIVGCGGFGLVYKATLANGTKLAVKKLSGDLGLMEREFRAEVEALSTAQHKNLVSLQGYCVHEGYRLLIYSYMENGSLDYWLHEKPDGASQLDWPTRLKIARGTSCGLAYMHRICEPHIVHRDIKSSNILLDDKFEAHLADFGLSRLILPYHTHVTTELVGTLGYIPPEYGQAWVATLRGDMYSFGVVMLELLTGKRPVEVFKPKLSRELVGWVQQMRSEGKQDQVFDPIIRGKGFDEEMLQVLDVACMCVSQNPFKRPTIKEVVEWLKNVGVTHRNENKGC